MATRQELHDALLNFQSLYNENAQLGQMNRDWNRVVLVKATDTGDAFTIVTKDGGLTVTDGAPASHVMEISSDSETLTNLFWGEIGPTEPYMNGTLKVKGTEADVLRLDFVTAMIWGE